jgi:hypothetical protein
LVSALQGRAKSDSRSTPTAIVKTPLSNVYGRVN